MSPIKPESHENAFGFLRLLFASLVILAHTPELCDGNRHREILTMLFGTISSGDLAVDGFFFISGYLISASYLKSRTPASFLKKRILRIYPAFIAAYLICDLIVAPLGGGDVAFTPQHVLMVLARILLLQMPASQTAFHGTYYPELNDAMWTISYEFKCYLLILALGLAGMLNRKRVVALAAIALLVLSCIFPEQYQPFDLQAAAQIQTHSLWDKVFDLTIGDPHSMLRFIGVFLCGTTYQLYRDRLHFDRKRVAIFSVGLIIALFEPAIVNLGVAVFGGYLILAFARPGGQSVFSRINNENDISYGVYLYAWPITKLLLWYWPDMNVVLVGILTWIGAASIGTVSWHLLEKPIMHRVRRNAPSARGVVA
ncbi:acyltransferase family protein [Paraburkholderia phosphatilytica]|uniref:acyltransferase family protein n=1 Tax=Paraburkholderia phosphatilytica TaxID=2282883 RepID=UPI000E46CCE3|nr:acyltransferase [Paraburkholderia phosphatilytica]